MRLYLVRVQYLILITLHVIQHLTLENEWNLILKVASVNIKPVVYLGDEGVFLARVALAEMA